MWMLAPQIREQLEILRVAGEPFDDAAVLDVGEGIVDVRQLVDGDLGRHDQLVARKHVSNDRRLRCDGGHRLTADGRFLSLWRSAHRGRRGDDNDQDCYAERQRDTS